MSTFETGMRAGEDDQMFMFDLRFYDTGDSQNKF